MPKKDKEKNPFVKQDEKDDESVKASTDEEKVIEGEDPAPDPAGQNPSDEDKPNPETPPEPDPAEPPPPPPTDEKAEPPVLQEAEPEVKQDSPTLKADEDVSKLYYDNQYTERELDIKSYGLVIKFKNGFYSARLPGEQAAIESTRAFKKGFIIEVPRTTPKKGTKMTRGALTSTGRPSGTKRR